MSKLSYRPSVYYHRHTAMTETDIAKLRRCYLILCREVEALKAQIRRSGGIPLKTTRHPDEVRDIEREPANSLDMYGDGSR